MSHNQTSTSSLENINENLFKKACEIVAKRHGGEVVDYFEDYYGKKFKNHKGFPVICAVKTPVIKRGIGAILKNGKLQFVGDSYGYESKYEKIQKEIEKTYIDLCIAIALNETSWDIANIFDLEIGKVFDGEKE